MLLTLSAITPADAPFLLSVYAATRAEELALTDWSDQQKQMFLRMQFEAQHHHYQARYPNAAFNVIKSDERFVGRLYTAELADEIRIIDITILPERRNQGIGTKLVEDVLLAGATKQKPVQIYIENYNRSAQLFSRLGFKPFSQQGVHVLWRHENARR